jgi:hypothetical protein
MRDGGEDDDDGATPATPDPVAQGSTTTTTTSSSVLVPQLQSTIVETTGALHHSHPFRTSNGARVGDSVLVGARVDDGSFAAPPRHTASAASPVRSFENNNVCVDDGMSSFSIPNQIQHGEREATRGNDAGVEMTVVVSPCESSSETMSVETDAPPSTSSSLAIGASCPPLPPSVIHATDSNSVV